MKRNILLICIFISIETICFSNGQNECTSKQKCGECIQTNNCGWCIKEDFEEPRCLLASSDLYNSCINFTINPMNSGVITISEELTSIKLKSKEETKTQNEKIVQIKPQQASLKLRPNEKYELNFQYSHADDYPVDLYYLMDLSTSMAKHKDNLSELGNELAIEMRKLTRNFQLGFGSFVDKVLLPFTSTMAEKLKNPCSKKTCPPPYSYIHHMTLGTNESQFAKEVNDAQVSGNLDSPEGGFDALMQAIVCRKEIGWREEARRLVIFSTDASFHYAGDGKLAGLIEPNDGKCHMEKHKYTHAEILDYPSVSHLNHVIRTNAVTVIFAVTEDVKNIYEQLSNHIEGSSYGVLGVGSSTIVDLIKSEYSKISSGIEIKDNAASPISIRYLTSCLTENGTKIEQNKCTGLKNSDVVNFTAEILVTECPKDKKDWKQTIQLYPVGINEMITIEIEIICDCDCEKPDSKLYEANSAKCNGKGTYKCGLCDCNDNYIGQNCECSSEFVSTTSSSSGCRPNNLTFIDCSGSGTCTCGVCICNKRPNSQEKIGGRYCECDNFSCLRKHGLVCSGADNGICECGNCRCHTGWSGSDCGCKTSKDECYPPTNTLSQEICSGHGKCECGACRCADTYSGQYCENCRTCEKPCDNFKNCTECQIHNSGPLKGEECSKNCTQFEAIAVDKIENKNQDQENEWTQCKAYSENNCEFLFEYKVITDKYNKYDVRAEKDLKCTVAKDSALKTAAYVIFPILSLGVFFLFSWKVITTIHDRREYSKFEKDKSMAKWDTGDNPLYKEATAVYRNPGFDK